jgi:4-hydroxybenzoyl-CoA thioesterase
MFSARITVRFGDADPAGLVYYPVIFHYFHVAMEEFFAARCGTSYACLVAEERLGFPTVKVETEFFSPLFYGDEAEVEVSVPRVGTSSVTFEYAARRALPVPENLRRAFAEAQGSLIVNRES